MRAIKGRYGWALTSVSILAVIILLGCQTLKEANPVAPALQSGEPELIAFALEGSYTIVQAHALEFARAATTPQEARNAIAQIDARINPVLDAAKPLAIEAQALRDKLLACEQTATTDVATTCSPDREKLAALMLELDALVTKVAPMINEMLAAIKGGE